MNAVVFSYTRRGARLSLQVKDVLEALGYATDLYTTEKFLEESKFLKKCSGCISSAAAAFQTNSVIIYIGSCGIAVRAIAPQVKSKLTDPAVISIDERGQFVIPLLAGHIGGANAIARKIALAIQAEPIITTATDINGLFAVDEWAAKNDVAIDSMLAAKKVAAALVDGQEVGLISAYNFVGSLPKGVVSKAEGEIGIVLGADANFKPFTITLNLMPKVYYLGIGCRRNTPLEKIEDLVLKQLDLLKISLKAVKQISSVDLKKDELGLLAFASKNGIPTEFYTAEELAAVPGEFTASKLVKSVVGVENVCERSAVLAAEQGEIVLRKTSLNGVTLAIAQKTINLDFHNI